MVEKPSPEIKIEKKEEDDVAKTKLEDLDFSSRTLNALLNGNYIGVRNPKHYMQQYAMLESISDCDLGFFEQ